MLLYAALVWLVLLPLLLLPLFARRSAGDPAAAAAVSRRTLLASTLHFVVAFNLVFFVQELFLVLPKAFTPGLEPTLFHNNHSWSGTHPLAALFQGTGALATLLLALAVAFALRRPPRRAGARLALAWIVYCGVYMALPQFVIGAVNPRNDVGMAFDWFGWSGATKLALAVTALLLMAAVAAPLARVFLALAPAATTARARLRALARLVAWPALLAQPLLLAFRIPRDWLEVVLMPLIVVACGVPWLVALGTARTSPPTSLVDPAPAWWPPALAGALLLAVFQIVLRPGIAF